MTSNLRGYFHCRLKRWLKYVNLKLNTSADKISYSLTQFVDSPIYCQLLFYFGLVTFLDLRGKSPITECEKVFFANWISCKKSVNSETPRGLHLFLKSSFDQVSRGQKLLILLISTCFSSKDPKIQPLI